MQSGWIRKAAWAVGALVAVVAIGLGVLVATFDANAYKGVAIDWMKTHRDRTLTIDGPVKFSVFPRIEVELSEIALSEKGRTDRFVSLHQAALSVDLLPLLRRQLVVDRIAASGVRLAYRRDKSGHSNIDDLLTPKADTGMASAPADGDSTALRFDVSEIKLDDVSLHVDDAMAGRQGDIVLKSLRTGRLADGIESDVKLDAEVTLSNPALKGRVEGETRVTPHLAASAVQLRDMKLGWIGDAFGVSGLDLALRGALGWGDGVVKAEDLDVSIGATLGDLRLDGSRLATKLFLFDPAKQNMSITQLQVKLAGRRGGHPLSATLDWPELTVNPKSLSGSAISGQFAMEGPTEIEATFQSAAPSGTFERIAVPQLEAKIQGKSGPRQIAAELRADLVMQPAEKLFAIDSLAARLNLREPSLQPLDLDVRGLARASPEAARWSLRGQINANPFTSNGEAALAAKPMRVQADARFAALDLNRLLPPKPAAAPKPVNSAAPAAETPVDLSPLRAFDGSFAFRAGTFAHENYRIENLQLDASLDNGLLRVEKLAGRAWGGSFEASATANARDAKVTAKATADNVDVNALMKDVADKDLIEGTGRVTAQLNTSGDTVSAMKSRLAGSGSVQLKDGAVKGVNLARSLRQARAALTGQRDAVQQAKQTEKTDFSSLAATFTVRDGIARSNDLDLKSPFLRIGGDGFADIGRGRIDYTAKASVANTSKGQEGADFEALRGVTVPVQLTGPFDSITWNIQWSLIAADLVKNEVAERAREKLTEQLRAKLNKGKPPANAASSAPASSSKDRLKDQVKEGLRGILK